METQKNIRDGAKDVQEYVADLGTWIKEIKQKDQDLKTGSKQPKREYPPPRSGVSGNEQPLPKSAPTSADPAAAEKEKGNELFKRGKFKEAIEAYTRSIELDPKNASIPYANRAMSYLSLKQYESAERDCTSSINLDYSYVKAYSRRGTARKALQKYQEAIQDFQTVLRLESSNKHASDELKELDKLVAGSGVKAVPTTIATEPVERPSITPVSSRTLPKSSTPSPLTEVSSSSPSSSSSPAAAQPSSPLSSARVQEVTDEQAEAIEREQEQKKRRQEDENASSAPATKKPTTPPAGSKRSPTSVSVPVVSVSIPAQAPTTAYEFESFWNSVKDDVETFYKYLKLITPSSLPSIFKSSLNPAVFTSIIIALERYYVKDDVNTTFAFLLHLSRVNRFSMNLMFLSDQDKQALQRIFDVIGSKGTSLKPEELPWLRSIYSL